MGGILIFFLIIFMDEIKVIRKIRNFRNIVYIEGFKNKIKVIFEKYLFRSLMRNIFKIVGLMGLCLI